MNYTKEQNKEFAIKLLLMEIKHQLSKVIAVNRGDLTNKDLKFIIKRLESK